MAEPDEGRHLPLKMPSPTREECLERQELDDGALNDTVYVVKKRGNFRVRGKTYHDDDECEAIQQSNGEPYPHSREKAQRKWLAPCLRCVLPEANHE